jgi:hypothetical protein
MQPVAEPQQRRGTIPNGANGKSAIEGRSKLEEKIPFRRTPSKNVIKII